MSIDLSEFAKEKGIKYFMISFTDIFGVQRAKLVPSQAIKDTQAEGAGWTATKGRGIELFGCPPPIHMYTSIHHNYIQVPSSVALGRGSRIAGSTPLSDATGAQPPMATRLRPPSPLRHYQPSQLGHGLRRSVRTVAASRRLRAALMTPSSLHWTL